MLRRFRRTDLTRILEIEAACFPRDAYPREMFLNLQRECGPLFLVAVRRGGVVGYIVSCARNGKGEVISIAVDPAWREQGLGSALLDRTLERLRRGGAGEVWLMVRAASKATIRFYRRFGFRRAGLVRRYYHDGGDGLRMRMRLA